MRTPVTSTRGQGPWLAGLFAGALALRLAHVATVRDSPFFEWLMLDPRLYDEWAQRIAAGDWLGDRPFFQDPLYAYLLAVVYRVAGHHYTAVVVLQALLGATVAPLLFAAARRWLGFGAAAVAGLLAATYRPSVYYDALILKTSLATWLVTVALWLLSHRLATPDDTTRPTPWETAAWAAIGGTFGLAVLARGNLLLFLPVLALWLLVDAPIHGAPAALRARLADRRVAAATLAVLAGALVVIGPVALRNRAVGTEWILTTSNAGQNFYIGNNPANTTGQYEKVPFVDANPKYEEIGFAREAEARAWRSGRLGPGESLRPGEISRYWFGQSLGLIRDDPAAWIGLLWRKLRVYWGAYEVPDNLDYYLYRESAPLLRLPLPGFGLVAPLGLAGALLLWRRPGWPRALLVYLVVYASSVVLFFVLARFRMPMMPVLFVFAGHAVAEAWLRVRAWRTGTHAAGRRLLALGALLGALFVWVHVPVRARPDSVAYRLAETLHLPRRAESSAQGHFNLGVSYAAQAKDAADEARLLALAEQELRTALAADARWATTRVELGKVLARQERTREAIEQYRAAITLEPRDYRNHHAIGLLERRLGDRPAAEAAFRQALALEPRHVATAVQLGEVLLEQERREEAAAAFAHALSLDPTNERARRGQVSARSAPPVPPGQP